LGVVLRFTFCLLFPKLNGSRTDGYFNDEGFFWFFFSLHKFSFGEQIFLRLLFLFQTKGLDDVLIPDGPKGYNRKKEHGDKGANSGI